MRARSPKHIAKPFRRKINRALRLIYKDRRYSDALAICTRIITADSGNLDAYEVRARAYEGLGRPDDMIADLDCIEALGGAYHTVYFVRASQKYRLKRYHEAIVDFDKAEACDTGYYADSIWLYRADCYAQLGLYEEALADCAKFPDGEWMPGFRNKPYGSKHDIIAEIKAKRGF